MSATLAERRPTFVAPLPLTIFDDVLAPDAQTRLYKFLNRANWGFGWKSNAKSDAYSFWHKHYAGSLQSDHFAADGSGKQYDCVEELAKNAAPVHAMWRDLAATTLAGHTLLRCYANGAPYGSEGSLHVDAMADNSYTAIYYPHETWHPNWGGETLFFTRDSSDVLAAVYPRPNRLILFRGTMPHVARGVSRICPVLRITLMFKTELAVS